MGRLLQLLFQHSREEILTEMSILLLLIALTAGTQGAPGGGHFAYGHQQQHCHTEYNIQIEQSCHDEYDQECHDEFDTVVDTTYVEECQDIITQHCHETTQQVHHSAAVVGQDSQVVSQGHSGLSKREAKAEPFPVYPGYGHNHHNNLQCFSTPHKQCHQKPVQNQRQECHEEYDVVVDTTYIEECQDIITTHCLCPKAMVLVRGRLKVNIHQNPSARNRRTDSATRDLSTMSARSPAKSAKPLSTQPL